MEITSTTEIIRCALNGADLRLKTSGPHSTVDRIHTAFHGYLSALYQEASITGLRDTSRP